MTVYYVTTQEGRIVEATQGNYHVHLEHTVGELRWGLQIFINGEVANEHAKKYPSSPVNFDEMFPDDWQEVGSTGTEITKNISSEDAGTLAQCIVDAVAQRHQEGVKLRRMLDQLAWIDEDIDPLTII